MENNQELKSMVTFSDQVNISDGDLFKAVQAEVFAAKTMQETKKSSEEKNYLLLLNWYSDNDDEEDQSWEIVKGRTAAYNFIKDNAEAINLNSSLVIVESVTLADALSEDDPDSKMTAYVFMKLMKDSGYFENDSFDIEDYM